MHLMQDKDLLCDCETLAVRAGKLLLGYWKKRRVIREKQSHNLVTSADIAAERLILDAIHKKYPTHAILSEEAGEKTPKQTSDYLWIVDPLDGTNNFAHVIPHFCTSIAVAHQGEVTAGAVYAPMLDELYSATRSGDSRLNGRPIHVRRSSDLTKCILAVGVYYDRGALMRETLRQVQKAFEHNVRGIRRMGSAAIDLCWVAAGRFSGFWEGKLSPWDYAAGKLIVERAGGKATKINGKALHLDTTSILCANPRLHAKLRALFSRPHKEKT